MIPGMRSAPSLRRISSVVLGTVAGLSLIVCAALVVLSTQLHRTTQLLANSVEQVYLTEDVEVDLFVYERENDPLLRREWQQRIRDKFAKAAPLVESAEDRKIFELARTRVEEYLAGRGTITEWYDALEELSRSNVAESELLRGRAARWGDLADALGVVAAILLLAILGILLWYLYRRAFRPLLALAAAIRRYGEGDRGARAHETGPLEVKEMAVRFNEMATSLAHGREAQMAFLAGVAHDLRNPLSALRLSVTSVRAEAVADPRVKRTFELVERQVTRLDRLVSDFLDVARIEAGELRLQLGRVDACEVIRHMCELFEATSNQHAIRMLLPSDEVPLLCDSLRVEQVLGNLISNAIKYSPGGGAVEVSLRRERGWAVISVRDEGVGLTEEDQRRIFEPFRRGGTTAQALSIPGVGLGLFVVKRIVEAHAGRIEVASRPTQGSEFRVSLPLLRAADVSIQPASTLPLKHE